MISAEMTGQFRIENEQRVLNLGLALGHPVRVNILMALKADPPLGAQRVQRKGIANVSVARYHMVQLESVGAIEAVRSAPRVPGRPPETLYELTGFGGACLRVAALIGRH